MVRQPRVVRDAILAYMRSEGRPVTISEISTGVAAILGEEVAPTSVRYLSQNVPRMFERVDKGTYRLARSR